jgi:hypothetical protein
MKDTFVESYNKYEALRSVNTPETLTYHRRGSIQEYICVIMPKI